MLGREADWAQIDGRLATLVGGGVVVALEGGPGIGKTTLWRAGVAAARQRGVAVRTTAPGEPDARLAFAGLGDLLDDLPREILADLPAPQRRAVRLALLIDAETDASPDPRALSRAVLTVLRGLAARDPLLVAIDDEQWLDPPTARVLAFALPRLGDAHVGVLMTRRPGTDGTLWPALVGDRDGNEVLYIAVEPLDFPAIDALLAERRGRRLPRPVSRRIYAASGGNPLYALAIARDLRGRGDLAGVEIPRTLTEAMADRLRPLRDAAAPLLVVAAASHVTLALVQAVTDGFSLSDLDAAMSADVIEITGDRIQFTHPLLASTVYASAPAAERRALHRRLAEVIDDPQQRARHLALGAEAPDREVASTIEQGATVADSRGAPDIAAELLEEAARLTPADANEARRLRLIRAAELHYKAGDAERTVELLGALLPDLPFGPVRARALLALSIAHDDFDVCDAWLEQALDNAGDHNRLRARILLDRSNISSNRGQFRDALTYDGEALAAAEQAGDLGLVARALANTACNRFFVGQPVDTKSLRRAVELEDPSQGTSRDSPSGWAALVLSWSDALDEARPGMHRAVQRARDHGEQYELAALLFEFSLLEWYAGNVELAESLQAACRETPQDDNGLWLTCGEAMFAARRGELEVARDAANRAVELAQVANDRLIEAFMINVLAALDLWTGQPQRAHDQLHALRESFNAQGFGFLGALTIEMWSTDIEALIALGRFDDAQSVVDDLALRGRKVQNPNAVAIANRCQGLVLAARGELTAALEQMRSALTAHEQRLLRPELARTLLEQGSLLRRAKQKNAAKASLEQALAIYEQIGARMWADRARDELNRVGLRRQTQEGLTPAQARVVELACAGHTNQQIAATLYMSVRSVESHLTKAYRQLGVKSRAQLIATIGSEAAGATTHR